MSNDMPYLFQYDSIYMYWIAEAAILEICKLKNATTFIKCYHAEIESRGPEDSKNVKPLRLTF